MQQPTIRYTLGKTERLKSRKTIDQLFASGKSFSQFPFRIVWQWQAEATNPLLQTGFSVSTRHFKHAVDRNRIRRLMKESYRLQKNPLQDTLTQYQKQLAVFIIYVGKEVPPYELVFEKMTTVIERLQKLAAQQLP